MINLKKIISLIIILYVLIAISFYYIAGEQLHIREDQTTTVAPESVVGELVAGDVVEQNFLLTDDALKGIDLLFATYGRQNTGMIKISVMQDNAVLHEETVDVANLLDGEFYHVDLAAYDANAANKQLRIQVESIDGKPGNSVTLWRGSGFSNGRFEIKQEVSEKESLYYNGVPIEGKLCFQIQMQKYLLFGKYYWQIAGFLFVLLLCYCALLFQRQQAGKFLYMINVITAFKKYNFLLTQLISRDFKTKYKRSVLGVLWSFLNPLLTMFVQYIVFSTIFKSSIPNFAVYLLIGIVCYSFFSEAVGASLMSIVGNATLITKVYVPKYIYPISRVCSSIVNLFFSLIPLVFVLIITRTPITKAILLAPFGLICLILFTTGLGLILSSSMVFFRDTQFLWGVVSLLWMYATPIFYPESIIPEKFMMIYKMNPLYHFIRFIRITLIDGVSPEPKAYLMCLIASIVPLLIGLLVFKKTQDQFVLKI